METLKEYKVVYTLTAEEDIISKAEYIEKRFRDSRLAYLIEKLFFLRFLR